MISRVESFRRAYVAQAAVLLAASLVAAGCASTKVIESDNFVLFEEAQRNIANRKFLPAIERLGEIGLITPVTPELDPDVKLALADAYFYQRGTVDTIEAQSRYEQFLAFYPLHEKADYARFQIGQCLFRQSESPWNDQEFTIRAIIYFQQLAAETEPGSTWNRAALSMVLRAGEKLAEHEFLVGRFYVKQKKYEGAVLRFEKILEDYPNSRHREETLFELGKAYLELDRKEQAVATLQKVVDEFPGSESAAEAGNLILGIP